MEESFKIGSLSALVDLTGTKIMTKSPKSAKKQKTTPGKRKSMSNFVVEDEYEDTLKIHLNDQQNNINLLENEPKKIKLSVKKQTTPKSTPKKTPKSLKKQNEKLTTIIETIEDSNSNEDSLENDQDSRSSLGNNSKNNKMKKQITPRSTPKKTPKSLKKRNEKLTTIIEKCEDDNEDDIQKLDLSNDDDKDPIDDQEVDEEKLKSIQEKQTRTLFVGNLPANFQLKNLKRILSQYGKVMSIRIRCVAPAKINLSKKVAYLSNQINENKKNVNAYVVFKEKDSVQKALKLNGENFDGNIIQVDSLENDREYDHSLSLFLGNLSFKTTEDEVREFFKDCGHIKSVRIVRDSRTGIGKGFGYVNFISKDSVVLAMEKNGELLNKREIRIKTYKYNKDFAKQKQKLAKLAKVQKRTMNFKNNKNSPQKNAKPNVNKKSFQGEQSMKKQTLAKKKKKSLKKSIQGRRIKKEKKKLSQII